MRERTPTSLLKRFGRPLNRSLGRFGYHFVKIDVDTDALEEEERALVKEVRPYTMTSVERIIALRDAVLYVDRCDVQGAIVECGVWRGGSVMAVAKTLIATNRRERDLYLFDTFEGMTDPTEPDIDIGGNSASEVLSSEVWADGAGGVLEDLLYASLAEVRVNVLSTGYPDRLLHFVKGPVEKTVPESAPEQIAILRLDTDWYESTKHELEHLVPRLVSNGVLIIDDYGHWRGARRAVDEYLEASSRPILLHRIDYSGRMAVVP
jgi:hypothetical protein